MTLKEYQIEAHKTAIYPKDKAREYLTNGLVSEIGELCGVKKKLLRGDFGEDEYKKRIMSEVGDCAWYIAEIITTVFDDKLQSDDVGIEHYNANERIKIIRLTEAIAEAFSWDKSFYYSNLFDYIIEFSGLTTDEFHQALDQNIAKLKARQQAGKIKGDGEVR